MEGVKPDREAKIRGAGLAPHQSAKIEKELCVAQVEVDVILLDTKFEVARSLIRRVASLTVS